jgi:hypothetical protein
LKCLEDWVVENDAVHVIEAFVEALDLWGSGVFERDCEGRRTLRPSLSRPPSRFRNSYSAGAKIRPRSKGFSRHDVSADCEAISRKPYQSCPVERRLEREAVQVADRGYLNSEKIKQCADAGVTVILPERQTSSATADGRFGRADFVYLSDQDDYRCTANQLPPHRCMTFEKGLKLRRYWASIGADCKIRSRCMLGKERRVMRREHEPAVIPTCMTQP